jgi:hypothetical protein
VTDKLYSYGAAKGVNANFGLEIRNSRDRADEFGSNPYVSRVAGDNGRVSAWSRLKASRDEEKLPELA